jgi:hypothetical protein
MIPFLKNLQASEKHAKCKNVKQYSEKRGVPSFKEEGGIKNYVGNGFGLKPSYFIKIQPNSVKCHQKSSYKWA